VEEQFAVASWKNTKGIGTKKEENQKTVTAEIETVTVEIETVTVESGSEWIGSEDTVLSLL
jgi:hypothetical protein